MKPFQDFISIKEITQLNNRVEEKEGEWRRGEEEEKREVWWQTPYGDRD